MFCEDYFVTLHFVTTIFQMKPICYFCLLVSLMGVSLIIMKKNLKALRVRSNEDGFEMEVYFEQF